MTTKNVNQGLAFGWTVSTRRAFVAENVCVFIATRPCFAVLHSQSKNFESSVRWVELGRLLVGFRIKAMRETGNRFSTLKLAFSSLKLAFRTLKFTFRTLECTFSTLKCTIRT